MQYDLELTWQAQTAIESLDLGEREEVSKSIERLRHGPIPPGVPQVYALRGTNTIYVMQAGRGNRLRILFTAQTGDRIMIHDVVSHDLVAEYRKSVAG